LKGTQITSAIWGSARGQETCRQSICERVTAVKPAKGTGNVRSPGGVQPEDLWEGPRRRNKKGKGQVITARTRPTGREEEKEKRKSEDTVKIIVG